MTDNSNRNKDEAGAEGGFVDDVRQRAIDAYDSARTTTSSAARKAGDMVEQAPLALLGAGAAVGALLAALLPASRKERELLKPYGEKITGAARDAAQAARDTGSEKLRELGLTPDTLAEKATTAAKASAEAAANRFRDEAGTR